MLCIETWSFGMGRDVWLNELIEWIETLLGWEEREGVRGSVRPCWGEGHWHITFNLGSLDSPIT